MDLRILGILAATAVMCPLLVAKQDQQAVILLESKLLKARKDSGRARQVYKKHAGVMAPVFMTLGMLVVCLTFTISGLGLRIGLGAPGVGLVVLGIVSRMLAFRRADQELS